jgi:hypothetical protein
MAELLIYTPKITQRVNYIFQLFFNSLIRTPFTITTDEGAFKTYAGPKLNYSNTAFSTNELQIIPCGLLTETDIKAQPITVSEWNNLKVFFRTDKGNLPFDIFSAAFYLVSRYEEYFPYEPDEHIRFHHTASLAYKNHFLNEPLINLWAEELKKIILAMYPAILFSENKYSFIPTIDIDVAYAHLGRSIAIIIGSYLKAISKFQIKTAIEKKLVFLHLKKDPYDTFDYQETVFKKYKLRPIYFLLAGRRGPNDKNISPESGTFKRLVKKLSLFADIGIHPSYQSESNSKTIAGEIEKVERNITRKITQSRQHYLKLSLPETYRCLAELGITDDYTMAYAGASGFRASICTPFLFYDLPTEKVLPISIHSSVLMDGTLNEYLKLLPVDAISTAEELIHKTKMVNGEFIPIWHNHSINEHAHWKGWRIVFETMIETGK